MWFTKRKDKKREAILKAIQRATDAGGCVILGETKDGTEMILIGRSIVASQLEEICKNKGVELR
uniref:Uncharacterized protein n=1 Tax=viral metagenome TaxID=1070528 RepID=A0A6M3JE10_9ZZZZ